MGKYWTQKTNEDIQEIQDKILEILRREKSATVTALTRFLQQDGIPIKRSCLVWYLREFRTRKVVSSSGKPHVYRIPETHVYKEIRANHRFILLVNLLKDARLSAYQINKAVGYQNGQIQELHRQDRVQRENYLIPETGKTVFRYFIESVDEM